MSIKTKVIFKNEHIKIIQIDFKKDGVLKEHKTGLKSQLFIQKGCVLYKGNDKEIELKKGESYDIPVNVYHSVEGVKKSVALLIQSL